VTKGPEKGCGEYVIHAISGQTLLPHGGMQQMVQPLAVLPSSGLSRSGCQADIARLSSAAASNFMLLPTQEGCTAVHVATRNLL
jgi:hypothetical protein